MKRICYILILCFLLLLTACAESDAGYGIPVCPDFSAVTEDAEYCQKMLVWLENVVAAEQREQ